MGKFLWIAGFLFLSASDLHACPLCHTSTAEEVRAGLQSTAGDLRVLLAVVLPFLSSFFLLILPGRDGS